MFGMKLPELKLPVNNTPQPLNTDPSPLHTDPKQRFRGGLVFDALTSVSLESKLESKKKRKINSK